MTTELRCPSCGAERDLDDDACPACGAGGGIEPADPALESAAAIDLHQLSDVERRAVGEVLTDRLVRHHWHGSHLLVAPHLVEEAELAVELVVAAGSDDGTQPGSAAGPTVVYEVGAWPVAVHSQLGALLAEAGIDHRWEPNGDLVVAEADEDAVESLFDQIDESELDEAVDPLPVLDALHGALARLSRDPLDDRARSSVVATAQDLRRAALPFGFDPPVWRGLVAATLDLADQLPGLDATRLRERAASLRNDLRSWL